MSCYIIVYIHIIRVAFVCQLFSVNFFDCIYIINKLHAHKSWKLIIITIRHGRISTEMQALHTAYHVREGNQREHYVSPTYRPTDGVYTPRIQDEFM